MTASTASEKSSKRSRDIICTGLQYMCLALDSIIGIDFFLPIFGFRAVIACRKSCTRAVIDFYNCICLYDVCDLFAWLIFQAYS